MILLMLFFVIWQGYENIFQQDMFSFSNKFSALQHPPSSTQGHKIEKEA